MIQISRLICIHMNQAIEESPEMYDEQQFGKNTKQRNLT